MLEMKKPPISWAVLANILLLTECSASSSVSSSVWTSSSSSSSSASSHSTSIVTGNKKPQDNGCGKNERKVECPSGVCVPKTCDDVGFPVACADLPPDASCPDGPGCICKEDYVRNKLEICIPMKQCPSCGGDKNAVSGPGINCNRLCSNYNNSKLQYDCPYDCLYNACECKQGFVFDEIKKKCVKPGECSTLECKINEVYDPCPAPCPLRTCGINDAAVDCVPALYPGHPDCAPPKCRCKDGFYRDDKGQCVTLEECPTCPGVNEMYDPCPPPCPAQRCDVDPALILCAVSPQLGDPDCMPGCRCIDGYVRNYTGNVCIKREDCPICPQNEIFDICDTPCPLRRCDVDERLIKCAAPPKPGDPNCVEGCRCVDGYKRDSNGDCIPKEDCPKCTNPHEVYDPCPPTCPPQTCESINKTYHCPNQPVGSDGEINQTCVGQCVCELGYYRNKIGECISKENCLKCTGPNEYFSCGPACDNVCGLLDKENQTNCLIKNVKCNDKCYCEEGYARDENNICVLIEDCKVPACKKYEKYDACPAYLCQPLNCSQLGFPVPCPSYPDQTKCPGNPGCICIDGYVRDDKTGRCIQKVQCPSCGGDKNATSGCGINCNTKCRDVGKKPGACIEVCYENKCDCKDGYYLDENTDQCVKPEDCSPVCPINEIYSECVQAICSPKKCSDLGYPVACPRIDPKYCKKGCVCRDEKVRNSKGICVDRSECPSCRGDQNATSGCGIYCNRRCSDIGKEPQSCIALCEDNACDCKEGYYLDEDCMKCVLPEDCPKPICNKNEYFNNCSNSDCSPQNCNDLGFPIKCTDIGDPSQCTKDCLCKDGYVRNYKGICVPSRECPSCGGDKNAVSGCGVYCNQKCSDIGKEPRPCILICYINACDCREGYYYDEVKKLCVPPSDCTPQCPENEYYSNCTNGDCSVQNCSDVGLPISCPRIDPTYCKGGCLCNEGYARNKTGVCVPKNECPTCKGDPNQVSGCGIYCNQKCSDLGKEPGACTLICLENACECRKGYYLDESTGRCVKPSNCPPQCPENEYYSNCTNGDCSVQNCTDVGLPISCPRINPKYCKKGCLCSQGYARNAKGICVPLNECPTCKGDPNRVSGCGVYCNQKCSDIGTEPGACIEVCYENDCDCREGYYLDAKTDKCVLPKDCNSCKNDPNRVPGCGVYCNQRCADVGKEPGGCIAVCYDNACDCKKGYFLDENIDKCVKPNNCTPVCSDNEVYSECINGGCDPKNCSQLGKDVPCVKLDPKKCIKGCLCKKGYLRAENGTCVPEAECNPNLCPRPNEEYNSCFFNCPPQTCDSLGKVYACPIRTGDTCKAQCVCKQGFYRNKLGDCISEANCRKCMGPHEYFSCGGACDNVCTTIKKQNQTNCPLVNVKCNEMCYCEKNYARALNKTCIPISKCNEPQCAINEKYEQCPQKLRGPFTCSQLGFPVKDNSEKKCGKPACVCIDGYLRDSNKVCIPKTDCPSCRGDKNAVSGCGNCIDRCEDLANDEPKVCTQICYENACDCRKGYYYDKKLKKCVLPGQCTSICDKVNEYFENCVNPICRANTCDELGFPLNCSNNSSDCKKGCYCKNGFVRNKHGKCIPVKDCPSCGGDKNAESGCGVNCLKHCYDLAHPKKPRPCTKICKVNACDCKDGFYLDENTGQCVKAKECSPVCSDNEVYSECINGGCDPKYCSQLGKDVPCVKLDPKKCIKGCLCKKGYLRAENGTCVPEAECNPNLCPRPNEEYNSCFFNCPPQTCESLDKVYACPIRTGDTCKAQCVCKQGFYRNKLGDCISEANCRKCMGPHEYFSCGGACDNVCTTIKKQNQTNCPLVNVKCNEMCYCEKNYARALNKTCIPISKCNEPQCAINGKYEKCPQKLRGPFTCSQLGFPVKDNSKKKCGKPACVCIDGYLRDSNKVCIPKTDCPSCRGDKNAVSGCGNCVDRCEDLANDEPKVCTQICYENACDCRKGYYYDKKLKKCVLPGECTSICDDINEYYDNCSNPICRANTCDELGFPLNCSNNSSDCKKGCYCKDGFVRNKDEKCIPVKDCPSCGGDKNAQSGCGVNCLKHCYDLANPKNPRPCLRICKINACDCKDGFYLDENTGQCVKAEDCSPVCGENEVYDPCTNGGCEFRNCSQIGGPQICIDPIKCIKGCKCKQDYLRAKNGTCIPIEKCPEAKCPKKERFEKCPAALCQPQSCDDLGIEIPCLPTDGGLCPGGPGCICEDEYVRQNGKCIPKRQCPSCGGDPNAWSGCGVNCGKHCDDVFNKTRPCPRICYPNSCDCRDGFYFNDITGKCVKSSDCPPPCPENEVRDLCVNGYCGIRNCSQANGPILCVDPIECKVGCTCVDGYLREDKTGVCVPECECPIPPEKCNPKCVTCINCTEGPPVNETAAIENFGLGNDLLNREFLYQLVKSRPGESFMFSVFSILIALAQLALYATGTALDQLLKLLNLDKDQIRTVFPILIKNYESQKSVTFELANKVYGSDNYPFTLKFKKEAVAIFNSEVENVNFANEVDAADIINDWVRNRTNNLIDNLVDPSMFNENTRLVLINVLYFLGNWVYPFNPNETTPQNFYYGKKDSEVLSLPTMCQQKRFLYAESKELDCQILRLPYKGLNFTFEIYLPRTRDGLESMIEKMRNTDNIFGKIRESLQYQDVRVCMPKMDISTDISDLIELLKMVNVTTIFDPNSNGFKCIFEDESSVYVSDAIQKSRIKVDESGTEAAVATAITITATAAVLDPPKVYIFNFNHPSAFCLMLNGNPITCGVFTGK